MTNSDADLLEELKGECERRPGLFELFKLIQRENPDKSNRTVLTLAKETWMEQHHKGLR